MRCAALGHFRQGNGCDLWLCPCIMRILQHQGASWDLFPIRKASFRVILGRETIWLWSLKLLTGRDRQVAWMHFFILSARIHCPMFSGYQNVSSRTGKISPTCLFAYTWDILRHPETQQFITGVWWPAGDCSQYIMAWEVRGSPWWSSWDSEAMPRIQLANMFAVEERCTNSDQQKFTMMYYVQSMYKILQGCTI